MKEDNFIITHTDFFGHYDYIETIPINNNMKEDNFIITHTDFFGHYDYIKTIPINKNYIRNDLYYYQNSSNEYILDKIPLEEIEKYLRNKKLKNLKNNEK